jgi:septal ring factor EnvC (AmiA/AmiB activator)
MADDAQQPADGEKAPLVDVAATADRLRDIASQSLDSNEVARQIEELTSVVLDSAEVSTRSASVAADISATMRAVVVKIQTTNRRNILHSRIVLGVFVVCLLVAIGIFLGISLKMTKSIKELDTMIYAMAKRVIEVDASLTAIGKTNSDFSELTDKQDALTATQTQVASRLDELSKILTAMPTSIADQSNKVSDAKFQAMQKQLQGLETKLQSMEGKMQSASQSSSRQPASVAPSGPSTQTLLNEIQKLKQDLNTSTQSHDKAIAAAERAASKATEKAAAATSAADKALASERAAAAERVALQKAAAERAAADKLAAERAAAVRIASEKAAAEKAAADKAAADKAAAEKAKAAASAPPKDRPIQYPRVPD